MAFHSFKEKNIAFHAKVSLKKKKYWRPCVVFKRGLKSWNRRITVVIAPQLRKISFKLYYISQFRKCSYIIMKTYKLTNVVFEQHSKSINLFSCVKTMCILSFRLQCTSMYERVRRIVGATLVILVRNLNYKLHNLIIVTV